MTAAGEASRPGPATRAKARAGTAAGDSAGTDPAPPGARDRQALVPGITWCRIFPGRYGELAALRKWLTTLLPDVPARDDVISVASELGANAVRHTASGEGGCFAVEVTWQRTAVRIAVADRGGASEPHVIKEPSGENGRGLLVVAALAAHCGVCGNNDGRMVWAQVPWDAADVGALAEPDGRALHEIAARLGRVLGNVREPDAPWSGADTGAVVAD